jgi:hypothetical protein
MGSQCRWLARRFKTKHWWGYALAAARIERQAGGSKQFSASHNGSSAAHTKWNDIYWRYLSAGANTKRLRLEEPAAHTKCGVVVPTGFEPVSERTDEMKKNNNLV